MRLCQSLIGKVQRQHLRHLFLPLSLKSVIFAMLFLSFVVSIAHRLSTVKDANQILVLDHGEIVERGSHKELAGKASIYAKMWRKQNTIAA